GNVMDEAASGSSVQAGALLRGAREAQGLHIAALAVALKVPVKKLEALEAGRFEELPDMVFVRSLALSVCRALRIDPASVMTSLPEAHVNQFKISEAGLNTTFKDGAGASHRGLRAQISSPIGLGVLLLIVAIAVILAWPKKPLSESESVATRDATVPVVATEVQNVQPPLILAGATDVASAVTVPTAILQPSKQEVGDSPVVAVTPDAAAVSSVLELSGRGESWVDVTDGAGQSRLRKLMQGGEIIRVTGQLPLSVTIGRADMVTVSVRGKPMDLAPLARDNVARFEVK
ncbi:MAG TPA: RodZ domain-containing protein, partial [Rhodoferax sp.]